MFIHEVLMVVKKMDFKKILEDLKKGGNNQFSNIIVICLIGVMLVIAASFFKGNSSVATLTNKTESTDNNGNTNNTSAEGAAYKSEQETKLKDLLQSIQGVGAVKVMIYFGSGEEQVPAYNQNTSSSVTNEVDNSGGKRTTTQNSTSNTVVITNDGDKSSTLIIKTNEPKVKGVFISAEGADDSAVRLNITNAVSDLFDISQDKVDVLPMQKSK